jgi:hypothetical protein
VVGWTDDRHHRLPRRLAEVDADVGIGKTAVELLPPQWPEVDGLRRRAPGTRRHGPGPAPHDVGQGVQGVNEHDLELRIAARVLDFSMQFVAEGADGGGDLVRHCRRDLRRFR